jgi:hypothetical protein
MPLLVNSHFAAHSPCHALLASFSDPSQLQAVVAAFAAGIPPLHAPLALSATCTPLDQRSDLGPSLELDSHHVVAVLVETVLRVLALRMKSLKRQQHC